MKRYALISTDSVKVPNIYSIGFSDDPSVTRYGPSVRNQYIIHYVLSGKGLFNGNKVEKGQGFLIVPGMHEEYYSDKNDPWAFVWIISEDPEIQYFFDHHNANEKTGIFKFHNLYEINAIARALATSENRLSSSTQLSELFLHIFHSCIAIESKPQRSATQLYFEFSVNYSKTTLHLPISVNDLCNAIGVTQPYLYRIFKERVNCSPKQYILNFKLAEAKRLLIQTELSISHIADSVGFQSVLDFSKFFSKRMNIPPTTYRNTYRRDFT